MPSSIKAVALVAGVSVLIVLLFGLVGCAEQSYMDAEKNRCKARGQMPLETFSEYGHSYGVACI